MKKTGLGDLFILAKYRAYRLNTPDYTLGIAPTLGLEFPPGIKTFSSETWDLNAGLYMSWRRGLWASDSNIVYKWNGFADSGENCTNPGDELSLNMAFAYQFVLGKRARSSLAPVLELNFNHIRVDRLDGHNISDTGETVLHFSSGVKFTTSSLILEVLLQNPVTSTK
ncbi:transporter [Candidatus Latescibacterota bacterium]